MDIRIINTLKTVSDHYGVSIYELKSRSRTDSVSKARIHAFIIFRDTFNFTYKEIGEIFNRTTSSIIQLVKTHRSEYEKNHLKINPKQNLALPPEVKNKNNKNIFVKELLEERERLINIISSIDYLIKIYGN